MIKDTKLIDTISIPGSRLDDYWNEAGFSKFYKQFRKGVDLPKQLRKTFIDPSKINERYHLKGFQFGNWATNEDRYNYLAALYVSLYDINKVLKFHQYNLGFNILSFSFGARGSGSAAAHFEPHELVINITRYSRESIIPKKVRFRATGGVGAVAHEYGHFLDYLIGTNYDRSKTDRFLSGGRSLSKARIQTKKGSTREAMENLIMKIIYKDESKKEISTYYKRLNGATNSEYWFRRNELFARIFEQYISHKLHSQGVYNHFLSESKYNKQYYMTPQELKSIIPSMDVVIKKMRAYS
jgi:hypothetical protein